MDGHFDGNSIIVELEVNSPISKKVKQTLPFKIDTGFTNDLCITYKEAFPLALTLVGIQDYQIADGSSVQWFECLGLITSGSKQIPAVVSVRPSGSLLMGISLMRKLSSKLEIDFTNQKVHFSRLKRHT